MVIWQDWTSWMSTFHTIHFSRTSWELHYRTHWKKTINQSTYQIRFYKLRLAQMNQIRGNKHIPFHSSILEYFLDSHSGFIVFLDGHIIFAVLEEVLRCRHSGRRPCIILSKNSHLDSPGHANINQFRLHPVSGMIWDGRDSIAQHIDLDFRLPWIGIQEENAGRSHAQLKRNVY